MSSQAVLKCLSYENTTTDEFWSVNIWLSSMFLVLKVMEFFCLLGQKNHQNFSRCRDLILIFQLFKPGPKAVEQIWKTLVGFWPESKWRANVLRREASQYQGTDLSN